MAWAVVAKRQAVPTPISRILRPALRAAPVAARRALAKIGPQHRVIDGRQRAYARCIVP